MEPAPRKIIHVDMDAFFASVEQRDHPELRGKPVAVGGSSDRGVVAAASYEARRFGVRSAMPSRTAARLCPDLIFVKHRFDVYQAVSRQVMDLFREYTDLVEPLSLDEAFLDVTHNKQGMRSATQVAQQLRQRIREETALTASAGVSFNKFLAKIASDLNKPDGLAVITPDQADAFIAGLPIEKFFGVGEVTAKKLHRVGIHTGADLRQRSETELVRHFGKMGRYFYRIARGDDQRPVRPDRIRKSIGAERTFSNDLDGREALMEALDQVLERVWERIDRSKAQGRTVTVKIKYHDFTLLTRSKSTGHFIGGRDEIASLAHELLHTPDWPEKPVRLLGVTLSNLDTELPPGLGHQLTFDF